MQNFSSLKCIGSSETISRNANPLVYLVNFRHDKIAWSQGLFDFKIHPEISFFYKRLHLLSFTHFIQRQPHTYELLQRVQMCNLLQSA